MNHSEKIEDINALTQVLDMMRTEINRVRSEADKAREYAPDAADVAYEKLSNAESYWEEANERLGNARETLDDFLELAKLARDAYDIATKDPSSVHERKASRAREQADRAYVKLENSINRTRSKIQKVDNYINKASSRMKIALIKAQANEAKENAKKVRINFTLPEYMKDDWQDMATDLSTSVSQMIREAMTLYTSELKKAGGSLERGLTKFGAKMEQMGQKVEDFMDENLEKRYDPETGELKSVIIQGKEVFSHDDIKEKMGFNRPSWPSSATKPKQAPFEPAAPAPPPAPSENQFAKERMKKRVTGLIRIQKALPIPKLAQSLEISEEDAENIIYELVAEGIDGTLKGDTFKFNGDIDAAIEVIHHIIDKL